MSVLTGRALFSDRLALWMFVAYGIFMLGFFFFPERPLHYKFYYAAVLLPGLFVTFRELPLLWKGTTVFRLLLLWLAYQLLSALWSHDFSLPGFLTLAGWWIQVLVFVVVTASLLRRFPVEFDLLSRILVAGVAILALVSIFAWYQNHPFPAHRLEPLGRIDNAILAGCAYGVFTLLALHYLVHARRAVMRILYATLFLVLISAVLLTHSRTAILGLLAAFIVMPLCSGRRAVLLMLVLLVAIGIVAQLFFPEVFDRFYMSVHWRPLIWQGVLGQIADAPWFGHGYLSDTSVAVEGQTFMHAHSSYLGFLRDGGLAGFAIFVALVAVIIRTVVGAGCSRVGVAVPLLVFAFVVIAPDVDRLIVRPRESWLFFWWPLALFVGLSQSAPESEATSPS